MRIPILHSFLANHTLVSSLIHLFFNLKKIFFCDRYKMNIITGFKKDWNLAVRIISLYRSQPQKLPASRGVERIDSRLGTADADASGKTIVYTGVKNSGDGAEFLAQFGWVVSDCTESEQITVPAEFDDALEEYNALQIEQGLDLKKYRRKKVDRYTYEITNYPDYSGKVRASILVYRGRVIGGDVSTADAAGFTVPLAGGGAKGADKLG